MNFLKLKKKNRIFFQNSSITAGLSRTNVKIIHVEVYSGSYWICLIFMSEGSRNQVPNLISEHLAGSLKFDLVNSFLYYYLFIWGSGVGLRV